MSQAALIFPHQLFAEHPALSAEREAVLVEDPLFFGDARYPARFHRMKLVLHRASMKRYAAEALRGRRVRYVDYAEAETGRLLKALAAEGIRELFIADPVDFMLEKRLTREAARHGLAIHWLPSPAFLNTRAEVDAFYADRARYHQTDFYIWQRKKHGLLLDGSKPLGGRWTFDTENRQKLKPNVSIPAAPAAYANADLDEARATCVSASPPTPARLTTSSTPPITPRPAPCSTPSLATSWRSSAPTKTPSHSAHRLSSTACSARRSTSDC